MIRVEVQVQGTAALLMHNVRLANPLDEFAKGIKAITSKQRKTDADYEEIFKLEFAGGLYYTEKMGPFIPNRVIRAAIIAGARMIKKGTAIERGMLVEGTQFKLVYEGTRDRDKMYQSGFYTDIRSVSGQGARGGSKTMRCRPIFEPPWSVTFALSIDQEIISPDDLKHCVQRAGAYHGFGDGRSEGHGRFEIADWRVG
jgi:hypothetical protein